MKGVYTIAKEFFGEGPLDKVKWSAFRGPKQKSAVEVHDYEDASGLAQRGPRAKRLGEIQRRGVWYTSRLEAWDLTRRWEGWNLLIQY